MKATIHERHVPLFYVAALYNLVAVVGPLFATNVFYGLFFAKPSADLGPEAAIHTQAFWVSVALFGVGYLMVARDPIRNRAILWLAAPGKTYVAVLFAWHYWAGDVTVLAALGGLGDLAFALLFLRYLLLTRGCEPPAPDAGAAG
jgi:hypothetical protein